MLQRRQTSHSLAILVAAAAGGYLASACSPVTPSMDKISSIRPKISEDQSVLVTTVSQLDDLAAKLALADPNSIKITLSEEENAELFAQFRETGKTELLLEGRVPEHFSFLRPGYEATHDKKLLEAREKFTLVTGIIRAADKKRWTLTLTDGTKDLDAGKSARQQMVELTFVFNDEQKNVTPEPEASPAPEPSDVPSPDPSPVPSDAPPVVP